MVQYLLGPITNIKTRATITANWISHSTVVAQFFRALSSLGGGSSSWLHRADSFMGLHCLPVLVRWQWWQSNSLMFS